ncbi:MAG: hypothetical protein J6Y93_02165 [Treponema sp.]|nr:hypothetical protein [Treponema sp.]
MKTKAFFRTIFTLFILAGGIASAQSNPLIGKTYSADIMGIAALNVTFNDDDSCILEAIDGTDISNYEKVDGSYKYLSNATVSITADDGSTLDFVYDKANDILRAVIDEDNGIMLELKPKTVKALDPNAVAPETLAGRTYSGSMLGKEFIRLSFTDDKNCDVTAFDGTDSETVKCTYTYDKSTGELKFHSEDEDFDDGEFRYEKGDNTIKIVIPDGFTLSLEQIK